MEDRLTYTSHIDRHHQLECTPCHSRRGIRDEPDPEVRYAPDEGASRRGAGSCRRRPRRGGVVERLTSRRRGNDRQVLLFQSQRSINESTTTIEGEGWLTHWRGSLKATVLAGTLRT
jgi:hypothetical protein